MSIAKLVSVALFAGLSVFGCQNVIGVSDLEVTGASSGETSTTTTSSSSSSAAGSSSSTGGGACSSCQSHFGCDPNGVCYSVCDEMIGCAPDSYCSLKPKTCMACGSAPPKGPCPGGVPNCDSCDPSDDSCVIQCDIPGKCAGTFTNTAKALPVRIVCNDQCDGLTITTASSALTEVVCTSGCNGLTLDCAPDGACKLTCNGTGCVNAKVDCGGNECTVACAAGAVSVEQMCNNSCSCAKTGCN